MKSSARTFGQLPPENRTRGTTVSLEEQVLRAKHPFEFAAYRYVRYRCSKHNLELDPRWTRFEGFLADVGPRPTPFHTIVQLDRDRACFGPENARWMSRKEQSERRRTVVDSAIELEPSTSLTLQTAVAEIRAFKNQPENLQTPALDDWRYSGPMSTAEFNIKYNSWRAEILPKYAALGMPELFYLFERMDDYVLLSELKLNSIGLPHDVMIDGRAQRYERQYKSLQDSLTAALASIRRRSKTLAAELESDNNMVFYQRLRDIYAVMMGRAWGAGRSGSP